MLEKRTRKMLEGGIGNKSSWDITQEGIIQKSSMEAGTLQLLNGF